MAGMSPDGNVTLERIREAYAPLKDVLADSGITGVLVDDREASTALRKRNAGEDVAEHDQLFEAVEKHRH